MLPLGEIGQSVKGSSSNHLLLYVNLQLPQLKNSISNNKWGLILHEDRSHEVSHSVPLPISQCHICRGLIVSSAHTHSLFSQSSGLSFISEHSPAHSSVCKLQWQPSCSSSGDLKRSHYLNRQDSLESRGAQWEGPPGPARLEVFNPSEHLHRLKHVLTFTLKSMISLVFKTQRGTPSKPQMSIFVVPKSWMPWWNRHFSMWGLIYKNFLKRIGIWIFRFCCCCWVVSFCFVF